MSWSSAWFRGTDVTHATGSRAAGKVKKPHKGFPLFQPASGESAKKSRCSFLFSAGCQMTLWGIVRRRTLADAERRFPCRPVSKHGPGKLMMPELVNKFRDGRK